MAHKERRISIGFCISMALMLLLMPFSWLMAMLLAAFFHELGHLIPIYLLSGQRQDIKLSIAGARIDLPNLDGGKEMICALSGPVAGFFLLFLYELFPKLALCALFQSLYNLLPIYPLDGGRALRCFLTIHFPPPIAAGVMYWVTLICKFILFVVGVIVCFRVEYGFLLFFISVMTIVRAK